MRVMTYNVRSCRGTDGRVSPERIAEVIAVHEPDVVALQELDRNLERTGGLDQAELIARALNMEFHFHPSFGLKEGYYGNAVLSRFPMELVRAGELPTLAARKKLERRGAIWVRLGVDGDLMDFFTTDLGLNKREKLAQARELAGANWLGAAERAARAVFCGDLNVTRWSAVHRTFRQSLREVRPRGILPLATWPSRFPVFTLDHIFASRGLDSPGARIAGGARERVASDHLPVIADMETPALS